MVVVSGVQTYQPGRFFQRLLAALRRLPPMEIVLIDGYVWLDNLGIPGLGARLFQALEGEVPVIGIAKTKFRGAELCQAHGGGSGRWQVGHDQRSIRRACRSGPGSNFSLAGIVLASSAP
jgi:deoxyinosine 3'endonuclease (endonuclease V)